MIIGGPTWVGFDDDATQKIYWRIEELSMKSLPIATMAVSVTGKWA
jgi:hypothetical protein